MEETKTATATAADDAFELYLSAKKLLKLAKVNWEAALKASWDEAPTVSSESPNPALIARTVEYLESESNSL